MNKLILTLTLLLPVVTLANPTKQIKKQMCFETYPSTTYSKNNTHEWTVNEVIQNPSVYKTFKIYTANKTKISDSVIFDFTGISRQYNKIIPVTGSAVFQNNQWTVNVNSQTSLEPPTYVSSLATWSIYSNINDPGTANGFLKFDSVPSDSSKNVFETSIVNSIDCVNFENTVPN